MRVPYDRDCLSFQNDSKDAKEKFQEIGYAYKYLTEGRLPQYRGEKYRQTGILRSMTRHNICHFPPASGRMMQNIFCLWCHREHGDSNKHSR